eukprot:scaffold96741_cov64-Phaeocystis_antarctica.AAC.2
MRLVIRHALPPRCFGLNSTTSIIGGSTALTSPRRWKYRLPALPGLYCRSGRTTPGAARAPPRSPRSDDGTSSFVRAPRPGEWASKRSGSSGPQSGGAAVGLLPRRASRGKAGAPIMVALRGAVVPFCGHQQARPVGKPERRCRLYSSCTVGLLGLVGNLTKLLRDVVRIPRLLLVATAASPVTD